MLGFSKSLELENKDHPTSYRHDLELQDTRIGFLFEYTEIQKFLMLTFYDDNWSGANSVSSFGNHVRCHDI